MFGNYTDGKKKTGSDIPFVFHGVGFACLVKNCIWSFFYFRHSGAVAYKISTIQNQIFSICSVVVVNPSLVYRMGIGNYKSTGAIFKMNFF